MANPNRPLSPHIGIYKWQITMVLSILHRITGVALAAGTLALAWWLVAAAVGPASYDTATSWLSSWIGQLILFGFTAALFYHLCNGIRHLIWDAGYGYEIETMTKSGLATVIAAAALTIIAWIAAYA